VCIDKDAAERKAIVELGLDFVTCKIHNDKTFDEKLRLRWKGKSYKVLREKIMKKINKIER